MALNGVNSNAVRFTKRTMGESYGGYASRAQPVKKVDNFFDDDDDVDDFETFENDKDFAKMKMSLNENDKNALQNTAEEDLGRAWGGETYSLKQEMTSNDSFKSASVPADSKISHKKIPESNFSPFKLFNKVTAKSTETTQVVKTATKEVSRTPNVTSYEDNLSTSTNSIEYDRPESNFSPFKLLDKVTAKSTEATQVVKTTTMKDVSRTPNVTSYEDNLSTSTSSIENVVQSAKSEMTSAERNTLQAEVKELRKTVLNLRQEHRKTPQACETIKKLMLNQPCVLERFKSLDDKLALLDEAIKIGDGNALITVLLFFKKTVKYSIFVREISRRTVATEHIVSFMKSHYEYNELVKLLRYLGRKEEAMMLDYKRAVSSSHPDSQLAAIISCQSTYEGSPELEDAVSVLKEHQSLLKRQIHIETKDKRTQAEGKDSVMQLHPRTQLCTFPLISTLYYCCFYHFGKTDNVLDPLSLQKEFKMTDKQFEWTAVGARAELKKWGDLEKLFMGKSWFGSNKLKSSLGFDKVVGILQRSCAPPDILSKYLALVEIPETRLLLATNLQCHKVAVETIVSMKDRQKLEEYRRKIDRCHPVQSTISSYLQNSQIKWK